MVAVQIIIDTYLESNSKISKERLITDAIFLNSQQDVIDTRNLFIKAIRGEITTLVIDEKYFIPEYILKRSVLSLISASYESLIAAGNPFYSIEQRKQHEKEYKHK